MRTSQSMKTGIDLDEIEGILTARFIKENEVVCWLVFDVVENEYPFDKDFSNCLYADGFMSDNDDLDYEFIFGELKNLSNKFQKDLVIEVRHKDDLKHIPKLLGFGFVEVKKSVYEWKRIDNPSF